MAQQSTSTDQVIDANGRPYNRLLLVLTLLVGTFSTFIMQTILTTAFPTLMKHFNITADTVQWLTTGFMLVMGIMIPITAWLLTRFNSKYLYITAMSLFWIGTFVCYEASSFGMLLTGRLIEAMGVGISAPVFQTIMLTIFPPAKRGTAMGLAGIVIGLAPAIGPTLSGWILVHYSWRMLFLVILPVNGFVLVLSFFTMRKVLQTSHPKIDILSVIVSTIGFGTMLYAFSSVGAKGWGDAQVYVPLIIGIIFVALFVYRQLHMDKPLLELRVFRVKAFTLSAILTAVAYMAMMGVEMILPLYIQTVRGESAFQSGLILLPGAIMMGIMSPITGKIFDEIGAKRLAMTGMILLTTGTVFFVTLTDKTPLIYITALYTMRMFGITMVTMPVTTTGMNALPIRLISHGTAVNNTARQVAASMGTAILISILTNVTTNRLPAKVLLHQTPLTYRTQAINANLAGYHAAFIVSLVFCAIGLCLTFMLKDGNNAQSTSVLDAKEAK
ncbi:multidrug transporter [Loigolactobacillus backii]|uniref:MDR family MFS transporter n=1 Tax=Loigolactobacillus backii TaxID=375175 RepID=UPI0007F171B3|nr:MDR family MFS transporter [Loigolactobacillus backii]ANK60959.1 multidrug transporter [Loigolactobacillus backii]ANK65912.1 multidrug transporter [Loigolactobacillus backii]